MQSKETLLKEIEYQSKMLKNLKTWMSVLIITSSLGLILAYWSFMCHSGKLFLVLGIAGIVIMIVSVILCAIVGLAFKNGKANLNKILSLSNI